MQFSGDRTDNDLEIKNVHLNEQLKRLLKKKKKDFSLFHENDYWT